MSDVPHGAPGGRAPDYVGLVAGVRSWRLANTMWARMGGWLWSRTMLDCWRKGVEWKEAECQRGHRIPDERCMCGIWAYYNLEAMEKDLGVAMRAARGEPYEYVSGIIGGGGDVIVHETGFRAQYAKVLAIFEDERSTPKREIAESYNCAIVAPSGYDAFCAERSLIRLDW